MENREFKDIREKLHDVQLPVDAGMWDSIESTMRRRRIRRMFLYASSAAAVLIAALFLFTANPQEPHISSMTAQLEAVQQTNEKTSTGKTSEIPAAAAQAEDKAMQRQASPVGKPAATAASATEGSRSASAVKEDVAAIAVSAANEGTTGRPEVKTDGETGSQAAHEQENRHAQTLFNLNGAEDYVAGISGKGKKGFAMTVTSGVMPGSSASVSGGIIKASSAGAGNISQSYNIEQVSDTRYSLPLNLGVQFQFPIGENMALGTGINYTMLRSRYDCLINKKKFNIKQTLHYIGIPVNIYGLIVERNNFSFYVNAGATIEKGIRAVYDLKSYNESEHNSTSIDGVQFSVNAGMGVEYRLGNTVGLYLEPNIVYYVDSDIPRSIRTDQPVQVKAELGFRFRF